MPPIAVDRRIFPVPAVNVKSYGPLTVLEIVISPMPALVDRVVVPVNVIAFVNERLVLTVRRVPAKFTAPPPL